MDVHATAEADRTSQHGDGGRSIAGELAVRHLEYDGGGQSRRPRRDWSAEPRQILALPENPRFDALYRKLRHLAEKPRQEEVVRAVERSIQDEGKALFLFSPFTLFAISDRVDFVAYDTCMSELAETRIKG